ncbi:hypothetical protein KQI68_06930 [Peptoniphilus sp. MSJ-1]|uniref:Uncharacterized protein n=1 Tax=Peptoniphilus ovalis TaxID=2841503 RepID=A0ABS6FHQ5_9FIRM|nr:hypothetical protein [Peptoniphilus ovalis]MBU5669573.1 hypothetical protein [Peptoniphilus ovalis]
MKWKGAKVKALPLQRAIEQLKHLKYRLSLLYHKESKMEIERLKNDYKFAEMLYYKLQDKGLKEEIKKNMEDIENKINQLRGEKTCEI